MKTEDRPSHSQAGREPLSQKLLEILQQTESLPVLTINELIVRTEGRGFYLVVIFLSLAFIVPVSIPGVSTVLGLIIALLCFRLAMGWSMRLPRFLGDRPLPAAMRGKVLRGGAKFLRFVEKLVRPRRTAWMSLPPARTTNALVMGLMACLLALPFPPLPPFTNSLPCYALILIAASMMEEDGVLIWFGYATAIGTVVYLAFIAAALQKGIVRVYEWFSRLW